MVFWLAYRIALRIAISYSFGKAYGASKNFMASLCDGKKQKGKNMITINKQQKIQRGCTGAKLVMRRKAEPS